MGRAVSGGGKRKPAAAKASRQSAKVSRYRRPQTHTARVPFTPMRNNAKRAVRFVVDNTYKSIPVHEAKLDRSGRYHKLHEYTLYVDIVYGDPDLIRHVRFYLGPTFHPQTFVCSSPIRVNRPNGLPAWRFSTTQQVYGARKATITLVGVKGSVDTHMIADMMPRSAGDVFVAESHGEGKQYHSNGWKIVPDGSIVCNRNMPRCNKFELVSNILDGGKGLDQIYHVTRALGRARIQINKSMGFHVHVDVLGYSIEQLIKICQNFIKYEDVMDSFMPQSRRSGSRECNAYFRSNRSSVVGNTNTQRHESLADCRSIEELAQQMNEDGRYYKLNLQNLVTRRQSTLEFRQHSATLNYEKISAWVRFCIWMVRTSARLKTPTPFMENCDLKFQFDALFQYVIKDRALRDFYKRQQEVEDQCCSECTTGRRAL
ncbi:putative amidoligase enzyme [Fragilaria crotonensis]|nr:putative amidoligase enzyme [Fragilaria crotonensis]